jgi:feruloyl-CoA synthase
MSADVFSDPCSLLAPRARRREDAAGGFVLSSPEPLQPYARCIGEWLEHWARESPDGVAFAERSSAESWRSVDWKALRRSVGSIAQGLLDLGLPAARPIVILSDNAIDHALLMLAAMHIGRTVCTVSSAYSRLQSDPAKIRAIVAALRPSLVYAGDAGVYGAALSACAGDAPIVVSAGAELLAGAIRFEDLSAVAEGAGVMSAFRAIRPDQHAKFLLTSGSTGQPKVVINTHRMLCANQQMIAQAWPFLARDKPVLLDWLPWSHTFGGNHNLNLVLRNGGTLFVDDGRPAPQAIARTLHNLRAVQPTLLFNVPSGFDMMLPFLEKDDRLAADVFARLQMIFYAGAALPASTWARLEAVARRVRAEPIWLTTSWGATETSPAVTSAHWRLKGAGCIGLPLPGTELKFVPNGAKLEMRVRGVSVFPGYKDAPAATLLAFDDEGFYKIGDAGFLVDDERPEKGVVFDGRVAEDFKLGTGTWVSVGTLRPKLVSALAPYAQDVVVAAPDRAELGLLVFPNAQAKEAPEGWVSDAIRAALRRLRAQGGGSSHCPSRALVLDEPPNAAAGEITDKGYLNQRAVLARRAADVEVLYAQPPDKRVIVASSEPE